MDNIWPDGVNPEELQEECYQKREEERQEKREKAEREHAERAEYLRNNPPTKKENKKQISFTVLMNLLRGDKKDNQIGVADNPHTPMEILELLASEPPCSVKKSFYQRFKRLFSEKSL